MYERACGNADIGLEAQPSEADIVQVFLFVGDNVVELYFDGEIRFVAVLLPLEQGLTFKNSSKYDKITRMKAKKILV
ncbi:MAG: hypothetical protein ACYC5N_02425, partial [Endomicrobiales bacterium]